MTLARLDRPEWATVALEPDSPLDARYVAEGDPLVPADVFAPGQLIQRVKVTHRGTIGDPDTWDGADHLTCRCGILVPILPETGRPSERCPRGHRL